VYFQHKKKLLGLIQILKLVMHLIYVMAKLWAKENRLDDALILNQNGNIIEAASSNIYWKRITKFIQFHLVKVALQEYQGKCLLKIAHFQICQ